MRETRNPCFLQPKNTLVLRNGGVRSGNLNEDIISQVPLAVKGRKSDRGKEHIFYKLRFARNPLALSRGRTNQNITNKAERKDSCGIKP